MIRKVNLISKNLNLFQSRFKFSQLIIGENNGLKLNKSFYKIFNATKQLKEETHLLLIGKNLEKVVEQVKKTVSSDFVQKVILVQSDQLDKLNAENVEQVVQQLIQKHKYKNVIGDSSTFGKDALPRIAANYNSQPVPDIIQIIDQNTFKRPCYAGNALVTVKNTNEIQFLNFRATSFDEISQSNVKEITQFEQFSPELKSTKIQFISEEIVQSDRPELTGARIVVSGGRGMKSGENFKLLEELATVLGETAIGASRAAVDAGFVSNDLQVGQTGKVVAPELYIAVGISGAIQHLAGMKDSKVIVAINKDKEAPIFEVANYGLVGDLFKIVPELTEKLKSQK